MTNEPPMSEEETSIAPIPVDDPRALTLLRRHWEFTSTSSPPECVHALDLDGLRAADVSFWMLTEGGAPLGCVALKELDAKHGEIKSMHVVAEARGRGLAGRLMEHLLQEARARGYERVSLETGTVEAFASSRRLYARYGFEPCPPFAGYPEHWFSVCMTRRL